MEGWVGSMPEFNWFLLTMIVAIICGILAGKMKIPLGGIIGALFGVILLNLITDGHAVVYSPVKIGMQITIGAISGSRVGIEELKRMKRLMLPAVIIYPGYFLFALGFGLFIYHFSDMDMITSLLMACPGGASDIALIAGDFGADVAYTGILHVMRVIFCCTLLPPIFTRIIRKDRKEKQVVLQKNEQKKETGAGREGKSLPHLAGLLAASCAGGLLFRYLGIASGAIIGALLFSILYSCLVGKCVLPKSVRWIQLIATGAYIGTTVTPDVIAGLQGLVIPVLILLLEIGVSTAVLSILVSRTKKMDLPTLLPCCSPGGMAEMILLADEIGGDVSSVAVIQAFRIVFVVTLFPTLLRLLTGFAGVM